MSPEADKPETLAEAELREELAITEQRRAEEAEAKAEEAAAEAANREAEKERELEAAEQRSAAAAAEAEQAREQAQAGGPTPILEPVPLAADIEGPEKPELHVAAAFAGAFLFAKLLKRIGN